jgi:hypothetical protein
MPSEALAFEFWPLCYKPNFRFTTRFDFAAITTGTVVCAKVSLLHCFQLVVKEGEPCLLSYPWRGVRGEGAADRDLDRETGVHDRATSPSLPLVIRA